jgi:hypothetical protein
MAGHVLGGKTDSPAAANSLETDGLALFAVEEHNKREVTRFGSSPLLLSLLFSAGLFFSTVMMNGWGF